LWGRNRRNSRKAGRAQAGHTMTGRGTGAWFEAYQFTVWSSGYSGTGSGAVVSPGGYWSISKCCRGGPRAGATAMEAGPLDELFGHSITYRVAVGPQQGPKVFTLQTLRSCNEPFDDTVGKVEGKELQRPCRLLERVQRSGGHEN